LQRLKQYRALTAAVVKPLGLGASKKQNCGKMWKNCRKKASEKTLESLDL